MHAQLTNAVLDLKLSWLACGSGHALSVPVPTGPSSVNPESPNIGPGASAESTIPPTITSPPPASPTPRPVGV